MALCFLLNSYQTDVYIARLSLWTVHASVANRIGSCCQAVCLVRDLGNRMSSLEHQSLFWINAIELLEQIGACTVGKVWTSSPETWKSCVKCAIWGYLSSEIHRILAISKAAYAGETRPMTPRVRTRPIRKICNTFCENETRKEAERLSVCQSFRENADCAPLAAKLMSKHYLSRTVSQLHCPWQYPQTIGICVILHFVGNRSRLVKLLAKCTGIVMHKLWSCVSVSDTHTSPLRQSDFPISHFYMHTPRGMYCVQYCVI